MKTEIEAKFPNIDTAQLMARLKEADAVLRAKSRLMRRKTLDYPDGRLGKDNGWVRVRDEGDKITVSYKQQRDNTLHGTKEICLVVDDFDLAVSFLESIGLVTKSYQETRRESWQLGDVEIEVDEWPGLPTFVELEAPDETELLRVTKLLGLDWSKAMHGGVAAVYRKYYDVTDDEVNNWQEIVFSKDSNFTKMLKRVARETLS